MRFFFSLIAFILLFSCTEKDKKKDTELNTYYSKYKEIYENHEEYGAEKTIVELDKYLKEFPNATDAHVFKAWIMAFNGDLIHVDEVLKMASEYDSTNYSIYSYWALISLLDISKIEQSKKFNQKAISLNSNELSNKVTTAWIYLFENKDSEALEIMKSVLEQDTLNNTYFIKSATVSSIKAGIDSMTHLYFNRLEILEIDTKIFNEFKNKNIDLKTIYKEVIK